MAIEIPGYEAVIENQVYARGMTLVLNGQSVDVKCLLLPRRYTEATKDQVVEYLPKKAEELAPTAAVIIPGQKFEGKSSLEQALLALSQKFPTAFNDLRTRNKDRMEFIRGTTPAKSFAEGETPGQYVYVRYGIVLSSTIQEAQAKGEIKDCVWYELKMRDEELRKQDLGERCRPKLLLNNGQLPDAAEVMNLLLKHKVVVSDTLTVSPPDYDLEEVTSLISKIYKALPNEEAIAQLTDVSGKVLDEAAFAPIEKLYMNEQKKAMMRQAMQAAQQQGLPPGMRIVMLRKPGQ